MYNTYPSRGRSRRFVRLTNYYERAAGFPPLLARDLPPRHRDAGDLAQPNSPDHASLFGVFATLGVAPRDRPQLHRGGNVRQSDRVAISADEY